MKDRLEEFVRSHNEEFDMFEPSEELWGKIEKSIQPKREIRWGYYLSRAAAIIFIVGATLVAQQLYVGNPTRNAQTADASDVEIPELREAEMYYTGMIHAKLQEVKPYLVEYPSLEDELNTDLSELDSVYTSLKSDLQDNVANHEVIEAMIQNYRLRISILEDMLYFLASQNEEEITNNTEQI